MMRRAVLAAALLMTALVPLSAQQSGDLAPWRLSWFPYLLGSPNAGVMGVAHAILFRQADWEDRVSLRDAVTFDAGYSTHDAWLLRARADFPRIADGWRLHAIAEASRSPRFGELASPEDVARQTIGVEASRRIAGRLQLAVRGGVEHLSDRSTINALGERFPEAPLESPCFLIDPIPGTTCDAATLRQTDATARVTLVLDLRDREYNTLNGALLESGFLVGSAADGYRGAFAQVKGWYSPRSSTHLSARGAARAISSYRAAGMSRTLPGWEGDVATFGGPYSQRGLSEGEYSGRGLLMAGGEFRQDVLASRGIFALSALAFVDAGRVFHDDAQYTTCDPCMAGQDPAFIGYSGGALRFTTRDWVVSAGGGVAVRVLRNAIVTVTAARGEGRTRWYLSSGWSW